MNTVAEEKKEIRVTYPAKDAVLTTQEIIKYICPKATEREAHIFLQLCKSQKLNPFIGEVYLIKYSENEKAQMVVGKETFAKRAERESGFDGFKAGIIIEGEGALVYREGSLKLKDDTILGGWAEVYRSDRKIPFRAEVSMDEYRGFGPIWKEGGKPSTMIRKVALVQALREAFPAVMAGLVDETEMDSVSREQVVEGELIDESASEGEGEKIAFICKCIQETPFYETLTDAWSKALLDLITLPDGTYLTDRADLDDMATADLPDLLHPDNREKIDKAHASLEKMHDKWNQGRAK